MHEDMRFAIVYCGFENQLHTGGSCTATLLTALQVTMPVSINILPNRMLTLEGMVSLGILRVQT